MHAFERLPVNTFSPSFRPLHEVLSCIGALVAAGLRWRYNAEGEIAARYSGRGWNDDTEREITSELHARF